MDGFSEIFIKRSGEKRYDCISSLKNFPTPKNSWLTFSHLWFFDHILHSEHKTGSVPISRKDLMKISENQSNLIYKILRGMHWRLQDAIPLFITIEVIGRDMKFF